MSLKDKLNIYNPKQENILKLKKYLERNDDKVDIKKFISKAKN